MLAAVTVVFSALALLVVAWWGRATGPDCPVPASGTTVVGVVLVFRIAVPLVARRPVGVSAVDRDGQTGPPVPRGRGRLL